MTRFLLVAATVTALAVPATSASATYEPFCGSLSECVTTCPECIGPIPDPLIGCWQTHDPHLNFCI